MWIFFPFWRYSMTFWIQQMVARAVRPSPEMLRHLVISLESSASLCCLILSLLKLWCETCQQYKMVLSFFFSYCHVIKNVKSFCSSQTSVFFLFIVLTHVVEWKPSHLFIVFFLVKCVFQYFEENSLPSCKVLQLASTSNYGEPS